MAKWKNKTHPDQITQKLNEIVSIDPANSRLRVEFGFPEYSYDGLIIVLGTMLEISDEISETRKNRILGDAITVAVQKGNLTEKSLLGEISRMENAYIAQSKNDYILASYVSADGGFGKLTLANRKINDTTITFTQELPSKFLTEYQRVKALAQDIILRDFPKRYQSVRVKVAARSPVDAAQIALNRLDLLRAIWNFAINRNFGLHARWSGGIPMPINPLVLGPLHTIHKPNGELASEEWWYEPSYIIPVFRFDVHKNSAVMYKRENQIRTQIKRLPYQSELEDILIRYVRALDETSWHNTFLSLWRILEQLVTPNGNYDRTTKRVSFLFEDVEYHQQVLGHLRHHRNAFVHEGNTSIYFETLAYQTKFYVDLLLEFHFTNRFGFGSLAEIGEMLDSPTDEQTVKETLNVLTKKTRLIEKVAKYRNIR